MFTKTRRAQHPLALITCMCSPTRTLHLTLTPFGSISYCPLKVTHLAGGVARHEREVRSEDMFGTPDQDVTLINPREEPAATTLGNEWRGFEWGGRHNGMGRRVS